jgi:hypothetical protein
MKVGKLELMMPAKILKDFLDINLPKENKIPN